MKHIITLNSSIIRKVITSIILIVIELVASRSRWISYRYNEDGCVVASQILIRRVFGAFHLTRCRILRDGVRNGYLWVAFQTPQIPS